MQFIREISHNGHHRVLSVKAIFQQLCAAGRLLDATHLVKIYTATQKTEERDWS